jgi:hypothetical protein
MSWIFRVIFSAMNMSSHEMWYAVLLSWGERSWFEDLQLHQSHMSLPIARLTVGYVAAFVHRYMYLHFCHGISRAREVRLSDISCREKWRFWHSPINVPVAVIRCFEGVHHYIPASVGNFNRSGREGLWPRRVKIASNTIMSLALHSTFLAALACI